MTFALVLTSIIIFLGFAMTWRASQEDQPLGDKGAMRNLSGVVYDNFGTRDEVGQDTRTQLNEINAAYNAVVSEDPNAANPEGEGEGDNSGG